MWERKPLHKCHQGDGARGRVRQAGPLSPAQDCLVTLDPTATKLAPIDPVIPPSPPIISLHATQAPLVPHSRSAMGTGSERETSHAQEGDSHLEPRSTALKYPFCFSPELNGHSSRGHVCRALATQSCASSHPSCTQQFLVAAPGTHNKAGARGVWHTLLEGRAQGKNRVSLVSFHTLALAPQWFSSSEKK